jgi:hypothetical protein
MRCAGLLDALGVVDCSGDGNVFEVYPAVALATWGLPSKGYKDDKVGPGKRREILAAMESISPWLQVSSEVRLACISSDHSLDALISSMIARAAAIGLTQLPATSEEKSLAVVEGWIGIPVPGSLERLHLPG